jgi:putative FmdB family regulatory protein
MPTYEYECTKCGHRFELFQRISDPPRKRCSKCRGAVRRLVGSGGGMLFKGSGFYATDYRSESYKKQKEKESGGKPKVKDETKPKPHPPSGESSASSS